MLCNTMALTWIIISKSKMKMIININILKKSNKKSIATPLMSKFIFVYFLIILIFLDKFNLIKGK